MKRMTMIAAALLLSNAGMAQSQTAPAPAPAPSANAQATGGGTVATATRLVEMLKLRGVLDTMFEQVTPLVSTSVIAAIERTPAIPAAIRARMADPAFRPQAQAIIGEEVLKSYRARYPQIVAAVAREYAASFSEADLQAAVAFYQSPVGQRFVDAQPRIQAAMSAQGQIIGKDAGEEAVPAAIRRIMALPAAAASNDAGKGQ